MKKYAGIILIFLCVGYFVFDKFYSHPKSENTIPQKPIPKIAAPKLKTIVIPEVKTKTAGVAVAIVEKPKSIPPPNGSPATPFDEFFRPDPQSKNKVQVVLPYVVDDGLAVVQGDIVLGRPAEDDGSESGYAVLPVMGTWATNRIPFHIQGNFTNPSRVKQALSLFEGTAIQFVPYQDQQDVLVFEETPGVCKSYVGRIGGKQPVWISPDCTTSAIAHEIMHALGFIHEQNRLDRDSFIKLNVEAIDEKYISNFIKLPMSFMTVSGQGPFDFESLMIYPTWMFAKGGHSTMQPLDPKNQISPGDRLSSQDIFRLNSVYGQ